MIRTTASFASLAAFAMGMPFAAASAQEQDSAPGVIGQVQLGDVWSDMDVYVPVQTRDAASTSTAVGNTAAALRLSGDVRSDIDQSFDATATATNRLRGYSAGTALATTTAYGNAASGGTNHGDNAYRARQAASGQVTASTKAELLGASQIVTATTAIANVSTTDNNFGTNIAGQTQYSAADVSAATDADMCCDGASATFATTAGANAASATGYTSSNYNGALQETGTGTAVRGVTDVYMNDGANVAAATNSFGNSATVYNEWGYATLGLDGAPAVQENGAEIDAQTYVTLDHWSGYATSTAYGVGNSALISNVGSDTALYTDQSNSGGVTSQARLTGQSWTGGTGLVSATSVGNAATATVCNYCSEASVGGRINQVNSGQVSATGQASTPYAGAIYGSATAVGNSATLQSAGD